MKTSKFCIRFYFPMILGMFILTAAAMSSAAQTPTPPPLIPHFDCAEPVYMNGVLTQVRAYFGYENTTNATIVVGFGPNNFFNPDPGNQYTIQATTRFLPGNHQRSFSILVAFPSEATWYVNNIPANTDRTWAGYCSSRKITYQGKLTNGNAAANGQYDLSFNFYDELTGGTSRDSIQKDNVAVTNGVFTVELDVPNAFNENAVARFLEISVRQTGSANPYTILAPRQPLTVAPFALKAKTAYDVRIPFVTSSPLNLECSDETRGQMKLRIGNSAAYQLYICTPTGWKSSVLQ